MSNPRLIELRSTGSVLKTACTSFVSNPVPFLFISLLILSLRSSLETGCRLITDQIDGAFDLKARQLSYGNDQLRRGSICSLDDSVKLLKANDSLVQWSNSCELVDGQQNVDKRDELDREELERVVDFIITALIFVATMFGLWATHCWACATVFIVITNDLAGRSSSPVRVLWDGLKLGLNTLFESTLSRWSLRGIVCRLLMIWFFRGVRNLQDFMKLVVRLELLPFNGMQPWVSGYYREISGFWTAWLLVDIVIGGALSVDPWITIVDRRKISWHTLTEACYLVWTHVSQAIMLRCLEVNLCAIKTRWLLSQSLGSVFAAFFQSTMEVYLMVVWLFFYLWIRCRDAKFGGRRFELAELEEAILGGR